jgi:hypothetical protein
LGNFPRSDSEPSFDLENIAPQIATGRIMKLRPTVFILILGTCCAALGFAAEALWRSLLPQASATVRFDASTARVVSGPLVVSENWPECTDLKSWTQDVMRLEKVEKASETDQAKAFFRWLRLFSKMATGGMIQAHEGTYGHERYVLDAHKNLFVYGWGYCDTHSRIAEAAWSEYKKDRRSAERVVVQHDNGGYHTMYRLRLDGHHAAFDARYGYYLIDRDSANARILDWAEVGEDQNILKNKNYRHRSQPFFEYFGLEWDRAFLLQPVYYESEEAWVKAGRPVECVFGNGQYEMGTPYHDMSFQLAKGMTIERFWDNTVRKFYVPKEFETSGEEPFRPSGRFYRVTETLFDGNWVKHDPNYRYGAPYVTTVPQNEGYKAEVRGGRTIGQAWGRIAYEPNWSSADFLQVSVIDTDFAHSAQAPYLRPAQKYGGGQAIFDFYSPYILVDGTLNGEWTASTADDPKVEIRVLQPKPRDRTEPDLWSDWQTLHSGAGTFRASLGRERYNGSDVGLHGVYRFQIRFSLSANAARQQETGLGRLKLEAYFENGIMSIPRIVDGHNIVRFKVKDASKVRGPVTVIYRYQTSKGERVHEQTLHPEDFQNQVATYRFDAAGLIRCNSLAIRY